MPESTVIIVVVVVYQVVLVAIGLWAQRLNRDSADYYLGGRRLGPAVAALSASTSSSSAWSLLGVSGAAYAWGLQAAWLLPAVLTGFVINWYWVAPRLYGASRDSNALTLVEFLAGPREQAGSRPIRWLGALAILFSFTFYVASQFQAAGDTFASVLPVDRGTAISIGALIVLAYVLLGGFWAASVSDALQGLLMLAIAIVLPLAAVAAVGGPGSMLAGLGALDEPGLLAIVDQPDRLSALVFVAGLFGIGLGYPGQPHVVNRFMAIEHFRDIRRARRIAVAWALVVFAGMIVLGWAGRVLLGDIGDREQVLFLSTQQMLPAMFAGIVIAGVLSAIMSTADSQLLVAASSVSHDLGASHLRGARRVVLVIGLIAVLLSIYSPEAIFNRVLFAWQALASAFGPLLLVLLGLGAVPWRWRLAAVATGFFGTIVLSRLPDAPADAAERLLPFAAAGMIALAGHLLHKKRQITTD